MLPATRAHAVYHSFLRITHNLADYEHSRRNASSADVSETMPMKLSRGSGAFLISVGTAITFSLSASSGCWQTSITDKSAPGGINLRTVEATCCVCGVTNRIRLHLAICPSTQELVRNPIDLPPTQAHRYQLCHRFSTGVMFCSTVLGLVA